MVRTLSTTAAAAAAAMAMTEFDSVLMHLSDLWIWLQLFPIIYLLFLVYQ